MGSHVQQVKGFGPRQNDDEQAAQADRDIQNDPFLSKPGTEDRSATKLAWENHIASVADHAEVADRSLGLLQSLIDSGFFGWRFGRIRHVMLVSAPNFL